MPMTIQINPAGGIFLRQTMLRPVVYLDHWAVRMFADELPLQERFIRGLHKAGGTLLFSGHNLNEFCTMTDVASARRAEEFLNRILPAFYIADFTLDPGFASVDAAEPGDHPGAFWLLQELGEACVRNGNTLTLDRMITDVVRHRDRIEPAFREMTEHVAEKIMSLKNDAQAILEAQAYAPKPGMKLRSMLLAEFMRDTHLNPDAVFTPNDASDLVHTVPSVVICDLVMLDSRWRDKVQKAARRLRRGGVTHALAKPFSKRANGVGDFLTALESYVPSPGPPQVVEIVE
jgi:hypothetical protein